MAKIQKGKIWNKYSIWIGFLDVIPLQPTNQPWFVISMQFNFVNSTNIIWCCAKCCNSSSYLKTVIKKALRACRQFWIPYMLKPLTCSQKTVSTFLTSTISAAFSWMILRCSVKDAYTFTRPNNVDNKQM